MNETNISWLTDPWVLTIVGGGAAVVLGSYLIKRFFPSLDSEETDNKVKNTISNTINIGTQAEVNKINTNNKNFDDSAKPPLYKETARILFIDDSSLKDKIQNLNRAGWRHVKQIKDMENADSREIMEADIIFVDYKGIGGNEEDQGLAVLSALNHRYSGEKWLILFTAYDVPVTAFDRGANDYLAKNSSKYETEQKIIKGLKALGK